VLREQLAELEAEIDAVVMPFRMTAGLPPAAAITPEWVDRSLDAEIARMRVDLEQTNADLVSFRDPGVLRQFLKEYRRGQAGVHEPVDLDILDDLIAEAMSSPRSKRRK